MPTPASRGDTKIRPASTGANLCQGPDAPNPTVYDSGLDLAQAHGDGREHPRRRVMQTARAKTLDDALPQREARAACSANL